MRYDLAIFDMDGTVLDTIKDLTGSLNFGLRKYGYPEKSVDDVRSYVGDGMRTTISRAVDSDPHSDKVDKIYECFREYYPLHCSDTTLPYTGIVGLLADLKRSGCINAIVSNKGDPEVKKLSGKFFGSSVGTAIGQRSGFARKPDPVSVLEVMNKYGIDKKKCVYIGDSGIDIETATNAGIDCISTSWGFKGRSFLEDYGAKTIVDRAEEIEDIILEREDRGAQ